MWEKKKQRCMPLKKGDVYWCIGRAIPDSDGNGKTPVEIELRKKENKQDGYHKSSNWVV